MSLSAAIESAVDSMGTPGQPAGGAAPTPAPSATAAAPETGTAAPAAPAQGAEQAPTGPGFIGYTPEQPAADSPTPEGAAKWQFAEGVNPDQVIATDDQGQPIKASDVQASYMRQADYTRKTTEMAEFRRTAEPAVEFVQQNMEYIQAFGSGDPAQVKSALEKLAQSYGVELGSPQPGAANRDPSGRFAPSGADGAKPGASLIDVSKYDEDSEAHEIAVAHNAQIERNQDLEAKVSEVNSKLDRFLSGVQTRIEQDQTLEKMESVASTWAKGGLAADVKGAYELVGRPITAEQAMQLHHWERVQEHNYRVMMARGGAQGPAHSEPGPSGVRPPVTPDGKSFSQYAKEAWTGG